MFKKTVLAILVASNITGCVSMLTHKRFSDTEVKGQAEGMAFALKCVENDLAPGNLVYAYGNAMSQLFSVSVYNNNLYEETYRNTSNEISRYPASSYANDCREMSRELPRMTSNVLKQYESIANARKADLLGMSHSLSSSSVSFTNYNYQSNLPTGNNTNFIPAPNRPNHYLVDFGRGQRICTATSSGYVRCN